MIHRRGPEWRRCDGAVPTSRFSPLGPPPGVRRGRLGAAHPRPPSPRPLPVALMTEGASLDAAPRILVLVALGAAVAAGAVLVLGRAEARGTREGTARDRLLRQARDQQAATAEILATMAASPPDLQRVL